MSGNDDGIMARILEYANLESEEIDAEDSPEAEERRKQERFQHYRAELEHIASLRGVYQEDPDSLPPKTRFLLELPPKNLEIIIMLANQIPREEIAKKLDLPTVNAVDNRISWMFKNLKKYLNPSQESKIPKYHYVWGKEECSGYSPAEVLYRIHRERETHNAMADASGVRIGEDGFAYRTGQTQENILDGTSAMIASGSHWENLAAQTAKDFRDWTNRPFDTLHTYEGRRRQNLSDAIEAFARMRVRAGDWPRKDFR